jgi:hypothetical protein
MEIISEAIGFTGARAQFDASEIERKRNGFALDALVRTRDVLKALDFEMVAKSIVPDVKTLPTLWDLNNAVIQVENVLEEQYDDSGDKKILDSLAIASTHLAFAVALLGNGGDDGVTVPHFVGRCRVLWMPPSSSSKP